MRVSEAPSPFRLAFAAFVSAWVPAATWLLAASIHWFVRSPPSALTLVAGLLLPFGFAAAGTVLWIAAQWLSARVSQRFPRASAANIGALLLALLVFVLSFWFGRGDLAPFVSRQVAAPLRPGALIALQASFSAAAVFSSALASRMCGPKGLMVALLTASTISLGNQLALPGLYWGLHLQVALLAWLLAAVSLVRVLKSPPRWARVLILLTGIIAVGFSAWSPTQHRILSELRATNHAWMTPLLHARFWAKGPLLHGKRLPELEVLMRPQPGAVTPLAERPSSPVVVLITIDALRADLLTDDRYQGILPNLAALKRESVFFQEARSNSSATAVSLAAIFLGKVFSEIQWAETDPEKDPRGYGTTEFDSTPRIGKILKKSGIESVAVAASPFLGAQLTELLSPTAGVDRAYVRHDALASASDVLAGVATRVKEARGALLVHAHLMDPHAPYDAPGHSGNSFEAYLEEVRSVDNALGTLISQLEFSKAAGDAFLIVTSDHGEAFGEHGVSFHASHLFEEMIRVPLLIRTPARRARVVEQPVSLVDLRPTLLDLFAIEMPHAGLGRSLVPLFEGENLFPRRATVIESGTRKRAIVFGNQMKLMHLAGDLFELYDLSSDAEERENLMDEYPEAEDLLSGMENFFSDRAFKRKGYFAPYIRP